MKHITKLLGIIFLLCLNVNLLVAQEEDLDVMVKAKMDSIFEHIDKSQFETGLLSDYGCLLIDPSIYDGTLNEMNYVAMPDWKFLYLGMYTARVNGNTVLKDPDQVFSGLDQKSPAILCLQYNRIDETALEDGRLIIKDAQLWETGRYGSPYVKKDLFAIGLPRTEYHREVSFTFSKDNYISNRKDMPTQLAVRFTRESGYRDIVWGQPVSYNFTSYGEKEISIRATYSDGKTLESHSRIRIVPVLPVKSAPKADVTIPIDPTSEHSGGRVQIKYAQFNKKGKLIKPLIIADESDISKIILEDKEIDLNYLFDNEMKDAMETINKLYDIVYIDNNDGFDDILRNAKLFEEAIQKINTLRDVVYDKSYVIGLGMGGLVARYALRDMENKGWEHNVQKYISINTPHKGANIPVGIQALLQYIQHRKFARKKLSNYMDNINKVTSLFDKKAIKQMLVYTINRDYQYLHDHDEFMQKYEAMGMPQHCENIAISNSGLSGMLEKEGSPLFSWNDKFIGFKCKIYFLKQQQASLFFSAAIKMIWCKFKEEELKSTNTMLAVDGAQGSFIPINLLTSGMGDLIAGGLKLSRFCFVPTASALGIANWQNHLSSSTGIFSTKFDRTYTSSRNASYTELTTCKDFLIAELKPQLQGDKENILGQRTFTLKNPLKLTLPVSFYVPYVKWTLSNDNFKIVSSTNEQVVVEPLFMNQKSMLKASIEYNGIKVGLDSITITSGHIDIYGDSYISSLKNRYEISSMPENASLSWRCSEGLIIEEQKDKYAIVYAKGKVVNPWVEAVITTVYGTETVIRKDLKCVPLSGASLQLLKIWIGKNEKGEYCKKYAYQLVYEPAEIPVGQLRFCWSSTVEASKESGGDIQLAFPKKATILTEGDVASSFHSSCLITDSVRVIGPPFKPVNPLFPNGLVSMASNSALPEIDPDLSVPYAWAHSVNYATVLMPQINLNQESKGRLYCVVRDYLGNSISVSSSEELWDKWQYEYHVAPNPVSTTMTVSKTSMNNGAIATYASTSAPEMLTLNLYNDFGLVRSMEADSSQSYIQMNVADLPNGTYYLNILKNGEVIDRQVVMIKH